MVSGMDVATYDTTRDNTSVGEDPDLSSAIDLWDT